MTVGVGVVEGEVLWPRNIKKPIMITTTAIAPMRNLFIYKHSTILDYKIHPVRSRARALRA